MSEAKNWKKKFLVDHPFCCFCGGRVRSVEPDHQPGRVFFRDRKWPEGFVFPSCEMCNRASRMSEDVVSLLTSYFADGENHKRYIARRDSVRINHPKVIQSLKMSANEKRREVERIGLLPGNGNTYSDLPIAKIDTDIWFPHFRMVGKKLALGLHYQCFQHPLPFGAAIYLSFSTNADFRMGHELKEILKAAPELVMPKRDKLMLGDQFAIRYGCSTELLASVFVINIQKRLIITALSVEDPYVLGSVPNENWVEGPFRW